MCGSVRQLPVSCPTVSAAANLNVVTSLCFTAFLLIFQVAGGEGCGGGAEERLEVSYPPTAKPGVFVSQFGLPSVHYLAIC